MKTLGRLSSFAAAVSLTAMIAMPIAPAQAQVSVQGQDALLGASIGALAGGLLGHGNIGPVLGGAAVGAAVGALAAPRDSYAYNDYGYRYSYPYGTQYSYAYPSTSYGYSYPYSTQYGYGSYPYTSYGGYYDPYGY